MDTYKIKEFYRQCGTDKMMKMYGKELKFHNPVSVGEYLYSLLFDRGMIIASLLDNVIVNKTQLYDIFNNKRNATRDVLISICIAMQLSGEEADRVLKCAMYQELYFEDPRDRAIEHCLKYGLTLSETDAYLIENGGTSLTPENKK